MRKIEAVDYSLEKAGVGGSIPSLATMFSITYKHLESSFGHNKFRCAEVCVHLSDI